MPNPTFPLSLTSLWISLWDTVSPCRFQLLPKTKVCVNLEVSQRWGFSQSFGLFITYSTRWLAYLGLRLPRHGFEQLMEMWPVALGVPARFVQRRQSLAVFHIANWSIKETDTNVWTESQLLHGRAASPNPVSSTSPQHLPAGPPEKRTVWIIQTAAKTNAKAEVSNLWFSASSKGILTVCDYNITWHGTALNVSFFFFYIAILFHLISIWTQLNKKNTPHNL